MPAGWTLVNGFLIGPWANLTGADLTGADLTGANLTNATLAGAKFAAANLTDVVSSGLVDAPASLPDGWSIVDGTIVDGRITAP